MQLKNRRYRIKLGSNDLAIANAFVGNTSGASKQHHYQELAIDNGLEAIVD
jgi:hypothetical protein